MRFVSLFAGIGGIDLGLERAGHTCVGQVEIDHYCQQVLAKHWPDVPRHDDVKTFHGSEFGDFDLLTGGYPCQPFSVAGQRKGENDERHLWPEVHRIIRNVRPSFVLLENVSGHLAMGFGRVLGDLAESGYDCEWDCIPASAVGAPHRRDRVFILAYPQEHRWAKRGTRHQRRDVDSQGEQRIWAQLSGNGADDRARHVADTNLIGRDGWAGELRSARWRKPPHRRRWPAEPSVGRVANGVPNRVDRLKALGNAVVPQVAEYLGRLLPEVAA